MKDNYVRAAIIGAVVACFGHLMITTKLDNIQAEIEHLEDAQNVWSLRDTKRIRKERRKEERRKEKERES